MLTLFGLAFCTLAIQPVQAEEETMTCVLIPGSETIDPITGIQCALYNCPNGEQVQSCHLPPVTVE
ncbi:hypothetical protein [Algoriphagus machipongonensis]|nr:hypothetical protein [Algoriphagus machipongonensis]